MTLLPLDQISKQNITFSFQRCSLHVDFISSFKTHNCGDAIKYLTHRDNRISVLKIILIRSHKFTQLNYERTEVLESINIQDYKSLYVIFPPPPLPAKLEGSPFHVLFISNLLVISEKSRLIHIESAKCLLRFSDNLKMFKMKEFIQQLELMEFHPVEYMI